MLRYRWKSARLARSLWAGLGVALVATTLVVLGGYFTLRHDGTCDYRAEVPGWDIFEPLSPTYQGITFSFATEPRAQTVLLTLTARNDTDQPLTSLGGGHAFLAMRGCELVWTWPRIGQGTGFGTLQPGEKRVWTHEWDRRVKQAGQVEQVPAGTYLLHGAYTVDQSGSALPAGATPEPQQLFISSGRKLEIER